MSDDIKVRGRVFFFSQRLIHPETKEKLIDENAIKNAVNHKSIKRYAYVLHDKDVYIEKDIEQWAERNKKNKEECPFKIGDVKDAHFHIALDCPTNVELECISKWFNVPENLIDIPKGRDAFTDCVEYETHEIQPEKHRYDDKEVKANFDFRKVLNERIENKAKYGKSSPSILDRMMYDIRYDGKRLLDVMDYDRLVYAKYEQQLKKLRNEYLSMSEPPKTRINLYVCGKGGMGKGTLCRSLARSMYPDYEYDDEIFFEIGANNATFEGYDGQPVIIWNDFRAYDLLSALGGRGNVFDVFDTLPTKKKQNIKYSSIRLQNEVNIVNSVQDYAEFLKGLSGEYTDKNGNRFSAEDYLQSGRRFPIIFPIYEDHFEMYLNNGWLANNGNFESYTSMMNVTMSLQRVAKMGIEHPNIIKKLDNIVTEKAMPIIQEIQKNKSSIEEDFTEEEIREMIGMNKEIEFVQKTFTIGQPPINDDDCPWK